jgi:hypothetical protein
MAKASVNEMLEAQGHRQALAGAFKNYMLTIPHRQDLGTYGGAARTEGARRRIDLLNRKKTRLKSAGAAVTPARPARPAAAPRTGLRQRTNRAATLKRPFIGCPCLTANDRPE